MAKKTSIILVFIVIANFILAANSLSDTEQAASLVNCMNGNQMSCSLAFQSFYNIVTIVYNSYLTNVTQLNPNAIPPQLTDPTNLNLYATNLVNETINNLNDMVEQLGDNFLGFIRDISINGVSSVLSNLLSFLVNLLGKIFSSIFNNGLQNLPNMSNQITNLLNATLSNLNLNLPNLPGLPNLQNLTNQITNLLSNLNLNLPNLPGGLPTLPTLPGGLPTLPTLPGGLFNKNQNNGPAISSIVDAISVVKDITNNLNNKNLADNLIKNITSILNNNGIDLRNLLNNLKVDNSLLPALNELKPAFSNVLEQVSKRDIQETVKNALHQLRNDPNQQNQIKKGLFNLFDINKGKK